MPRSSRANGILGRRKNSGPSGKALTSIAAAIRRGGPYGGKKYFSPYGNPQLPDGPDGEHLPDRLASETVKFIQDHREKPFLAYVAFYSVHTPLMARPDLVEKYQAKAQRLGLAGKPEFAEEEQNLPMEGKRQVRILQKHAVYAGMVEAMDQAVGKVLLALEEQGLSDKTAVVFMSDNGGLSTSEGSPTSNLPLRRGRVGSMKAGFANRF